MRKITKRSAAIAVAAVVAVGGAGAAWAAWSISGTGTASASAGTAVALTVTSTPVVTPLVPGSKSSVTLTVENDNKFPVKINSVTFGTFTSAPAAACSNNIEQVATAELPEDLVVGAEDETTFTFEDSLKLIDDPSNACQGQTFGFQAVVGATSDVS